MHGQQTLRCSTGVDAPSSIIHGIELLLKAWTYARNVRRVDADFAVEITRLLDAGVTECDLRWLVCKKFVLHLHDITLPTEAGRVTRHVDSLKFIEASCFVLTDIGSEFAESIVRSSGPTSVVTDRSTPSQEAITPSWDADARELRINSSIVKKFRVPAPNQERILAVFEEEDWPPHIYDPLPPAPEIDAKQRLHTAIRSLNRNQKENRLKFSGDGCGQGVCWNHLRPSLGLTE